MNILKYYFYNYIFFLTIFWINKLIQRAIFYFEINIS